MVTHQPRGSEPFSVLVEFAWLRKVPLSLLLGIPRETRIFWTWASVSSCMLTRGVSTVKAHDKALAGNVSEGTECGRQFGPRRYFG